MTIRFCIVSLALVVLILEAAAQSPATVKKNNGQLLKGSIQGTVIQGESSPVKSDASGGYGGLYYIAKGEQIESIDEDGVRYRNGTRLRYVSIGQKQPIDDLEVAKMAVDLDNNFMAMFDYSSKHNMASVKSDFIDMKAPSKLRLIGEYRNEGKSEAILPTLQINTATGKIAVPIADIVKFKVEPAAP
ncbi:MAG: hypothetical protein ACT4OT_04610 [Acidobacteriota bacterium]